MQNKQIFKSRGTQWQRQNFTPLREKLHFRIIMKRHFEQPLIIRELFSDRSITGNQIWEENWGEIEVARNTELRSIDIKRQRIQRRQRDQDLDWQASRNWKRIRKGGLLILEVRPAQGPSDPFLPRIPSRSERAGMIGDFRERSLTFVLRKPRERRQKRRTDERERERDRAHKFLAHCQSGEIWGKEGGREEEEEREKQAYMDESWAHASGNLTACLWVLPSSRRLALSKIATT